MIYIVAYARKVESDIYGAADSKDEYYKMLAVKIFEIQKKLKEKQHERKEMQLQKVHQVDPSLVPIIPSSSGGSSPKLPVTSGISQLQDLNEAQVASLNQAYINQSTTPVLSVSAQGSIQSGGKMIVSAGASNCGKKIEIDSGTKSGCGKSEAIIIGNCNIKRDINQKPVEGACPSTKDGSIIMKEVPLTPMSTDFNAENKSDSVSETAQPPPKLQSKGVKVPDENITPQQLLLNRQEQLAMIREMQLLLLTKQHKMEQVQGGASPNMCSVIGGIPPQHAPQSRFGPGDMGINSGMDVCFSSHKPCINDHVHSHPSSDTYMESQMISPSFSHQNYPPVSSHIEWQKLQHQFYEERQKKQVCNNSMLSQPSKGAQNRTLVQQQTTLPVQSQQSISQPQTPQQQNLNSPSMRPGPGPRIQGPAPPYQTNRRTMPSPHPPSPNTNSLSLPFPRMASGLPSPADSSRQFPVPTPLGPKLPHPSPRSSTPAGSNSLQTTFLNSPKAVSSSGTGSNSATHIHTPTTPSNTTSTPSTTPSLCAPVLSSSGPTTPVGSCTSSRKPNQSCADMQDSNSHVIPGSVSLEFPATILVSTPNNVQAFTPDDSECQQTLMPTLKKLHKQDHLSLPFCQPVDPKLVKMSEDNFSQQQMKKRLQKTLDLKQHIATLQNHETSKAQTCPETSNSSSQPYPDAQPHLSASPQPIIGMKPSTESPVEDLQVVQQVQGESEPHMVDGLFSTRPQMQKPISHMSGALNPMLNSGNIVCWKNSDYSQNSQPHQNPQAQIVKFCSIPNSIENSVVESPQIMKNSSPPLEGMQIKIQKQGQLINFLLKSQTSSSAQQQQSVLADVRSHAQVTATLKNRKKQPQLKQASAPNLPVSLQPDILCHPQAQVSTSQQEVKSPPSAAHFAQAVSPPQPIVSSKNQHIATLQNQGMSKVQTLLSFYENYNFSSPPYPVAQPHLSAHPQPVIGMKPSTGPPVVDLQVQAKTKPLLVAASVNNKQAVGPSAAYAGLCGTPQMQKLVSQMMSDAQNSQPHQNQPQRTPKMDIGQEAQIVKSCSMTNSMENSAEEQPHIMTNPASPLESMQRLVAKLEWQQLLKTLKSLASFEQQQQVLAILKSNPQLMASFEKQRSVQQQQQQQQMLINEENMITPQPPIYSQCASKPIPANFNRHQEFQEDNIQFQRVLMQHQIKQASTPTHLPVCPQPGILGHLRAEVPTQQQVQSPPPDAPHFDFPQAFPSLQPSASTKTQNQPIPFPQEQPAPSPYSAQTHSSHSVGTSRLTGPDQMTNNDDMMLTRLTNRVSSHSDLTGHLPGLVNQKLELSSTDNLDLAHLVREKQPDKYSDYLTYYFCIYCFLVIMFYCEYFLV